MEMTRIDSIVQFTKGSKSVWSDPNIAVPLGVVVVDTVNKIIKEGDGVTLYENLPVCLDYNFSARTSGAIQPTGDNAGTIAIADDTMYAPSIVKLNDILTNITAKSNKAASQASIISTLNSDNVVLSISEGVTNGTVVICKNGKYQPGTKTLTQLIADLAASASVGLTGMHITDLEWYTDAGLTQKVATQNDLIEQNTYWCKITGWHDNSELSNVDFGLATTVPNVTVTNSANDKTSATIVSLYGGTAEDKFYASAVDADGNIVSVGWTMSEGTGTNILIVKFDKDLNILIRKQYGGALEDIFTGIAVNADGFFYAVGYTYSEGSGSKDALIVKFDKNLNLLARKVCGGGTADEGFNGVAFDTNGNVYAAGYDSSDQASFTGFIAKFDVGLNNLLKKTTGISIFIIYDICISKENIVYICGCVGSSMLSSSAAGIAKLDTNLNVLASKTYGAATGGQFFGIALDASLNVYVAGYNGQEGAGGTEGMIVKYDKDLNLLLRKRFGGSGDERGYHVAVDTNGNVYIAGSTESEVAGKRYGLVLIFSSAFDVVGKKIFGGANGNTVPIDINLDNSGKSIFLAGYTFAAGSGNTDALMMKLPIDLPTGTINGSVISGLTLADSTVITVSDSTLTSAAFVMTTSAASVNINNASTSAYRDSLSTYSKDTFVAARKVDPTQLITTVYSSVGDDAFTATTIDAAGNIVAVGYTTINSAVYALVVRFSSSFVALARKVFTGNFYQKFTAVATDASNNIICTGSFTTSNGGQKDAMIAKFSADLSTIIAQKAYGGAGDDEFLDVVKDPSGNFIVCGYTASEGAGAKEGLVIKFDSNLNILFKKRYGGAGNEIFYGVAIDAVGNTICIGSTESEGTKTRSGLILKLDSNLNVVVRKYYTSTKGDVTEFYAVAVTATNVIFGVGKVTTLNGDIGLIVKFDSNLNVTAQKGYGGSVGNTSFSGVEVDSSLNVICVGTTSSEGAGLSDALIIKISINMATLGRKTYGSVNNDADIGCVIDANDDIIISGYGAINGDTDAIITKISGSLPTGIYTNKKFTDLILNDSKLTMSDDSAAANVSTLAMADSTLQLINGTMILGNTSGSIVTDTTIMDGVSNVFKVVFGAVAQANPIASFAITANDGVAMVTKTASVNVASASILEAVYGGSANDVFYATNAFDSNGNIIAGGYTYSEGLGGMEALVVKFDSNLNILARKRIGGTYDDMFTGFAVDSKDNIYAVGRTASYSNGVHSDCFLVKFDSSLNILLQRVYGASRFDQFVGVAVDRDDCVICVGHTTLNDAGDTAIIVLKFDSFLTISYTKQFTGINGDTARDVAIDASNNIVIVGLTNSEGLGYPSYNSGLIMRLDQSLNVITRKILSGSNGHTYLSKIAIDANGYIYAVGDTFQDGVNGVCLIVKFDSTLNVVAKKWLGGGSNEFFYGVAIDSLGNIYAVGNTKSDSVSGSIDCFYAKFNADLKLITQKRFGGSADDYFYDIKISKTDNVFITGTVASEGAGVSDALIVKTPAALGSGTFTGSTLTDITWADAHLTLSDSSLNISNSNLTVSELSLTYAVSYLTIADSSLTLEKDIIVI